MVNVMQYKAKEKDLFLALEIPDDIPKMLIGDKLRINQIFFNLVGNAVKFTDEGYVKIIVERVSAFEGGIQLKFIVEDTGIGIPSDKLNSVFESFSRIRMKDRIFEGTGLGLSIAKSLIEQQGGKIGAESELGKGSKFFFDMIFEIAANQDENQNSITEKEIDPDLEFRLLLVEDHKMNQLVARKTLKKKWENIDITIAENGKEAIDRLEKESFDIILMDVQMPVMDGLEATEYIRTQMPKETACIPILAMTAHAHISKDEKYKEQGFDNFVLKPFDPNQLFSKIAMYLKKKVEI
jgi:CheY-like chemotaxis protein